VGVDIEYGLLELAPTAGRLRNRFATPLLVVQQSTISRHI
jgi:hypothetical protein